MVIAWIANEYTFQTLIVGAILFPICMVWATLTSSKRIGKMIEKNQDAQTKYEDALPTRAEIHKRMKEEKCRQVHEKSGVPYTGF